MPLAGSMNISGKDFIYAFRALRKSPGFALAVLAIFTLGIGANTAIFGIVNAVLLKPLPFANPDSVVTVLHVPPAQSFPGIATFPVSPANYLDWRKQSTVFESVEMVGGASMRLGGGTRPQSIRAAVTGPDFFKVLKLELVAG